MLTIAASMLGVLGMNVSPAAAAATLDDGNGAMQMAGVLDPTIPCVNYKTMQFDLVFDNATVGSYTGPVNATLFSPVGVDGWWEFYDGTKSGPNACADTDPDVAIPGFSATLEGVSGSSTLACTYTASYHRNGDRTDEVGLDITLASTSTPNGQCGGETGTITIKTSIVLAPTPWGTACDSPIAPTHCVLGPARF